MTTSTAAVAGGVLNGLQTTAYNYRQALSELADLRTQEQAFSRQIRNREHALEPEAYRLCEEAKKAGAGANNADTRKAKLAELLAADPTASAALIEQARLGEDTTRKAREVEDLRIAFDALKSQAGLLSAMLGVEAATGELFKIPA